MSMSRRFYRDLAERFKRTRPKIDGLGLMMWKRMVLVTCDAMEHEQPSFDREKFKKACGYGDPLAEAD